MNTPPPYLEDPGLAEIEVIACDMDLTLLEDDKTLPQGIFERIAALDRADVVFCPASGRPLSSLETLFAPTAPRMAFMADNGGLVTFRGAVVFKDLLAPAVYQEICAACLESVPGAVPVVCGFDRAYVLAAHRAYHEMLSIYYLDIEYVERFEGLEVEADKATILFPDYDSERWFDEVFGPRFASWITCTCAGREWMDFMNPGVNKGAGLARLCAHMGAPLARAAAFGDTDNDAQMLEAAGHGFLMANADAHMYAHASYLVPSNQEHGVLQAIDAILAAKGVLQRCG